MVGDEGGLFTPCPVKKIAVADLGGAKRAISSPGLYFMFLAPPPKFLETLLNSHMLHVSYLTPFHVSGAATLVLTGWICRLVVYFSVSRLDMLWSECMRVPCHVDSADFACKGWKCDNRAC